MGAESLIHVLEQAFPGEVRDVSVQGEDLGLGLRPEALPAVMEFLKAPPFAGNVLLDITCVDYRRDLAAFEMVYHVLSLANRFRIRIKVRLPGEAPAVASLAGLWKNADWLEREVYDMFGVRFIGHPNLKRILMYDGFEGYPLRKDYPLKRRQERKDPWT
jgi:NADH-quinone oxidoreductase subunit C